MVLLTSSQVQVALSSAIICSFTVLLFLAGYISQQRSVEGLHAAIRPRAPSPRHKSPEHNLPPPSAHPISRLNRPLGRLRDRLKWQSQLAAADVPFDWSQLAFAQVVRDHSEICNAVIILSDLHKLKSSAPRLLLFPQHWIEERDGQELDPILETSKRLLKKASRWYRATLVPTNMGAEGAIHNGSEVLSIASLAMLEQYKKVMTFPTPGLILDTSPLDSILAFAEIDSIAAYPALNSSEASTILMAPSKPSAELRDGVGRTRLSAEILLPDIQDHSLFTTTHALRIADPSSFNAADFLASTAFIHFSDPGLPGPEYDIPYSNIVKMRPAGEDQSFLWEKMYSTYKDRRYGVCGLDLETWPPLPQIRTVEKDHEEAVKRAERTDL